jgi:hypothetical protein
MHRSREIQFIRKKSINRKRFRNDTDDKMSSCNGQEEGRTGPAWGGGDTSGRREAMGRECGRVNMVQILCTHVCKWKNETCCSCSRKGEIKENDGGGEFNYDIFDIL